MNRRTTVFGIQIQEGANFFSQISAPADYEMNSQELHGSVPGKLQGKKLVLTKFDVKLTIIIRMIYAVLTEMKDETE